MKQEFHVTDLGLQIDGRMVMPGSVLKLNSKPPAHWSRFGEYKHGPEGKVPEKQFEVATPAEEPITMREVLAEEYEELYGKKPHHKMKPEKIKAKIEEAKD